MAPGLNVTTNVSSGYDRLHALNACAPAAFRVRWILDVPNAAGTYALGPPTVSHGIVYIGTNEGHLVAIADPSRFPPAGFRCSHPDVPAGICLASGFTLVPEPAVLANVTLDGPILTEPAMARGRLYVATSNGTLYMLEP
jgi:outer membrane protein assembly factor BamB